MIDKRFHIVRMTERRSDLGAFGIGPIHYSLQLYCSWSGYDSYEWSVSYYQWNPTLMSFWKYFSTYAEAEKWLKENGYL